MIADAYLSVPGQDLGAEDSFILLLSEQGMSLTSGAVKLSVEVTEADSEPVLWKGEPTAWPKEEKDLIALMWQQRIGSACDLAVACSIQNVSCVDKMTLCATW